MPTVLTPEEELYIQYGDAKACDCKTTCSKCCPCDSCKQERFLELQEDDPLLRQRVQEAKYRI